jgi:hypothetical protein
MRVGRRPHALLAMQKLEGSNPFSRFREGEKASIWRSFSSERSVSTSASPDTHRTLAGHQGADPSREGAPLQGNPGHPNARPSAGPQTLLGSPSPFGRFRSGLFSASLRPGVAVSAGAPPPGVHSVSKRGGGRGRPTRAAARAPELRPPRAPARSVPRRPDRLLPKNASRCLAFHRSSAVQSERSGDATRMPARPREEERRAHPREEHPTGFP